MHVRVANRTGSSGYRLAGRSKGSGSRRGFGSRLVAPLVLLAVLSLFPGGSFATTFYAPLPDLVGPIDFTGGSPPTVASFDVGQEFTAIESVSIEIDAHLVAAQYDFCGYPTNPQPCVHESVISGVFAVMDEEDKPYPGVTGTSVTVPAPPGALEVTGTGSAPFNNDSNPFGWEILFDGAGSMTVVASQFVFVPGAIIQNFQQASGEIFGARIIIEGTPIPEPSTAFLMMIGLAALARTRRSRPWMPRSI